MNVMLHAKSCLEGPYALQDIIELGQGLATGDSRSQCFYGPPLLQDLSDLLYPRLIGKYEIASLSLLGERAIKAASLTSAGDKEHQSRPLPADAAARREIIVDRSN